jgi:truncated hemoglobin YjbI
MFSLIFTQAVEGAQIYSDQRSHATVRIHHFKWKINTQIRDLCSEAMAALMKKQSLDPTPEATLSGYFTHTGQYMINHE